MERSFASHMTGAFVRLSSCIGYTLETQYPLLNIVSEIQMVQPSMC